MANKHIKRCTALLAITEMQITAIMRHHLHLTAKIIKKKSLPAPQTLRMWRNCISYIAVKYYKHKNMPKYYSHAGK